MLGKYPEIYDIDDGFTAGKPQLDMQLTPEAIGLNLASADVARQVRGAFYGSEALRQQDGRNEVRVIVRLPDAERETLHDVETLLLRTPEGGEIPLEEATDIVAARSRPTILRAEGRRMVSVTAEVRADTSPDQVLGALAEGPLPKLLAKYDGLSYEYGGANREQKKAMGSLQRGGLLAMVAIFALLAIPFRSYIQPLIVMAAIPFGFIGALAGHALMGFELSMISIMGLVALAGVVVNDSLVLIDHIDTLRSEKELSAFEAVVVGAQRRFRAILLTTLTTFAGLTPLLLERSLQARFMIPMAISLAFGVLFATFITLVAIPALYMIIEDSHLLAGRISGEMRKRFGKLEAEPGLES